MIRGATPNSDLGTLVELKSVQSTKAKPADRNPNSFKAKFPVWNVSTRRKTTYHRQFFLDNVARTEVEFPDGTEQKLAEDFVWWFHDWQDRWKDPETRNGKRIKGYDNGISPARYPTSGSNSHLSWVKERFSEAPGGRWRDRVARETLKNNLPGEQWLFGTKQISLSEVGGKVRPFRLEHILIETAQQHGINAARLFQVPPEFEAMLFEYENEAQLAQDILDGLDECDILNLPIDEWYDGVADKLAKINIPFSSCDP